MQILSERLLVILLTLLLGLAPLQSALASFANSSDQEDGVHQMEGMPSDMTGVTDHDTHDCEQCNVGNECAGHDCSSSHCTSCVLALLPILSFQASHTTATVLFPSDDGIISQLSSSLFRPPRA